MLQDTRGELDYRVSMTQGIENRWVLKPHHSMCLHFRLVFTRLGKHVT